MFRRWPLAAALVTVLVAAALLADVTPYLRGGYGWRWPYHLLPAGWLLALAAAAAVYVAGAAWLLRRTPRAAPLLVWSAAGAVVFALLAAAAREGDALYALFTRTTALLGTGQHWASAHVDWAAGEWRDWPAVMARLGGHMSNVPPGAPLLYRGIELLLPAGLAESLRRWLLPYQCHNFDLLSYTPQQWASAVFGMLMPVWSALTVLPLYALARRFTGADARLAAVGWALVPAAAAFAPSWSTVYPLISLAAFWLLARGLEGSRPALWLLASGAVTGLGTVVNFALIPLPLFLGLFALLYDRRLSAARAAGLGGVYAAGVLLPWALLRAAGGPHLFDLLPVSMRFHLGLDRPYWFWVGMHFWDWVLWTGAGWAVLWLAGIAAWWRQRAAQPRPALGLALLLTLLALVFSGTARGETGRVWLFFSPFLLLAALEAWGRLAPGARHAGLGLAAQGALLVALLGCLDVVGTNFTPPPAPPAPAAVSHPVEAVFTRPDGAPLFRLTGWGAAFEADHIRLHLRWQGETALVAPYWFTAALVGPDGRVIVGEPWQPGGEARYPTTCWRPGTAVGDTVDLPLPPDAPPGDWWISLAVYGDPDAPDGRLGVAIPGQPPDTQIGLGPVRVPG